MSWHYSAPPLTTAGPLMIAVEWHGQRLVVVEDAREWSRLPARDAVPYAWQPMPEAPEPMTQEHT